eukprot:scaffold8730_cov83-Skeletonema_menzelii.AAC.1
MERLKGIALEFLHTMATHPNQQHVCGGNERSHTTDATTMPRPLSLDPSSTLLSLQTTAQVLTHQPPVLLTNEDAAQPLSCCISTLSTKTRKRHASSTVNNSENVDNQLHGSPTNDGATTKNLPRPNAPVSTSRNDEDEQLSEQLSNGKQLDNQKIRKRKACDALPASSTTLQTVKVKVNKELVHDDLSATLPSGNSVKVKVSIGDEPVENDLVAILIPSSTNGHGRRISSLSPTVNLLPEVTSGLGNEEVSSDKFKQLLGLGNGVQRGVSAVEQYEGNNPMLNLIKKHYKRRLKDHNKMAASECTIPPNRQNALEDYKEMGDLINNAGFVANLGELATTLSRSQACLRYATEAEIDYKHPDPDYGGLCKMDRSSPCPAFVGSSLVSTAMYHTTNVYNKAVDRPEIVMNDIICICLDKGEESELLKQCNTFLKKMGVCEYFKKHRISTYDAMFVIMVPTYAFNLDQIYYNKKRPVPVLAVGSCASKRMKNGCIYSSALSHGDGSMHHPEFLTDGMKQGSEQACVNSDACITAWLGAFLQDDLERADLCVNDLQCHMSWTLKYRNLDVNEIKLLEESLMSCILCKASKAVKNEKCNFPAGMSKGDIAEELAQDNDKLKKYGLNPRSMKSYVFLCRSHEKLALHQVSVAVKNEEPNHPGKSKGDVAEEITRNDDMLKKYSLTQEMVQQYVDHCRSRKDEALHQVSVAIKNEEPNHPGKSKGDIAEEIARNDNKLKEYGLTQEMVQQYVDSRSLALHQVSVAVKNEEPNHPGKLKGDIAEEIARNDVKLKEYGLTQEMVQQYVDRCRYQEKWSNTEMLELTKLMEMDQYKTNGRHDWVAITQAFHDINPAHSRWTQKQISNKGGKYIAGKKKEKNHKWSNTEMSELTKLMEMDQYKTNGRHDWVAITQAFHDINPAHSRWTKRQILDKVRYMAGKKKEN